MPSAREAALQAIGEVLGRGNKPREVLDRQCANLGARDRAFVMEAVYGVIRMRDTLDWALGKYLKKPSGVKGRTRDNLRLGAYQILKMRVPDWTAVDEAVGLEQKHGGLVNAVLRKIAGNKDSIREYLALMRKTVLDASSPVSEKAESLSVLASYPKWLTRRWINRLGSEGALALAEAGNRIPPLVLRVNSLLADRESVVEELRAKGIEYMVSEYSPEGIVLEGRHAIGDVEGLIGRVYIQDEAAQMVSRILGPKRGERVLDACAAPGGKTTHIAQLIGDEGSVLAVDIEASRMRRLEENIRSQHVNSVENVQGDAAEVAAKEGPFDRILLDAPCSALGVVRRNPDVKYRHRRGDLARFHKKQLELLRAVSRSLVPGGVLVYCTCSTEPEEGEEVIWEFLKTEEDIFNIESIPGWGNFMRTYPHLHGMDGFFVARLRRTK